MKRENVKPVWASCMTSLGAAMLTPLVHETFPVEICWALPDAAPRLWRAAAPGLIVSEVNRARSNLLGEERPDGRMMGQGRLSSMILGDAGALGQDRRFAGGCSRAMSGSNFVALSAVVFGVADLRKVFEAAGGGERPEAGTFLFRDEIPPFQFQQGGKQERLSCPLVEGGW